MIPHAGCEAAVAEDCPGPNSLERFAEYEQRTHEHHEQNHDRDRALLQKQQREPRTQNKSYKIK